MPATVLGTFLCSFYEKKVDEAHVDSDLDDLEGAGTKVWVGKDYCNFIYKDFVDLDKPFAGKTLDNLRQT